MKLSDLPSMIMHSVYGDKLSDELSKKQVDIVKNDLKSVLDYIEKTRDRCDEMSTTEARYQLRCAISILERHINEFIRCKEENIKMGVVISTYKQVLENPKLEQELFESYSTNTEEPIRAVVIPFKNTLQ